MIRRLLKRTNTITPLGRWQINDNRSEIRAAMANVDSCGDSLCGDPKMLKDTIEEIDKRIKKYEDEDALQKKKLATQQEEKNKIFFKSFK